MTAAPFPGSPGCRGAAAVSSCATARTPTDPPCPPAVWDDRTDISVTVDQGTLKIYSDRSLPSLPGYERTAEAARRRPWLPPSADWVCRQNADTLDRADASAAALPGEGGPLTEVTRTWT